MSNISIYEDGHKGQAHHFQVDSGFGFTCDEEILPFVLAFRSVGLTTLGSCQGSETWLIPRRLVIYTHKDPRVILNFALYLWETVPDTSGWQNQIRIDHYHVPDSNCFAILEFVPDLDDKMMRAIKGWK